MATIFRKMIEFDKKVRSGCLSKDCSDLYADVKSFILNGSFSDYTKKEALLAYYSYTDAVIASKLGVSETAVRKIKSRVSSELYAVLGSDVFSNIESGDEGLMRKVRVTLDIAMKGISTTNLFAAEFLNAVHSASLEEKSFVVSDCVPEISLLYWLNNTKVKDMISAVDADRLAYLLRVIDGKSGTTDMRVGLTKMLCAPELESSIPEGLRPLAKFPPVRPDDMW